MLLYLVRHGDPDYRADCLTERGKSQAEAVAKRLAVSGIDRIFSSPMGRAKETAAPLCRLLGKTFEVEEWARELYDTEYVTEFPDGKRKTLTRVPVTYLRENGLQDLPFERTLECPALASCNLQPALDRVRPGLADFLGRMGYREENGVYRILRKNEDKVALFCHHGLMRVVASELLHVPLHMIWADFRCSHTGVTVLHFKNYDSGFTSPICYTFSDVSHLYAAGLDTVYDNEIEI